MVCLGNICRSPLAEGVLKSKLSSTHFQIDSAATASFHIGKSPDHRSIKIAADHGIDISHQKARAFKIEDFKLFDKIYVMDKGNVLDSGNHNELLKKSETYKNFYDKQINKN